MENKEKVFMEGYIIVVCGYEGIEHIVGIFDKDKAIEKLKWCRENCGKEPGPYWLAYCRNPDQICVQRIDENGSECCCTEFAVPPKQGWLY